MIFPAGRKNLLERVSNRPKSFSPASKCGADLQVGICAVSSRADLKVSATAVGRWAVVELQQFLAGPGDGTVVSDSD